MYTRYQLPGIYESHTINSTRYSPVESRRLSKEALYLLLLWRGTRLWKQNRRYCIIRRRVHTAVAWGFICRRSKQIIHYYYSEYGRGCARPRREKTTPRPLSHRTLWLKINQYVLGRTPATKEVHHVFFRGCGKMTSAIPHAKKKKCSTKRKIK